MKPNGEVLELRAVKLLGRGVGRHRVSLAEADEVVVGFPVQLPDRPQVWFLRKNKVEAIVSLLVTPTAVLRQADCEKIFSNPPKDMGFVRVGEAKRRRRLRVLTGLLDCREACSGALVRLVRLVERITEEEYAALLKALKMCVPDRDEP